MSITLPIIEAREKLTSLPEKFKKNPELGSVTVTRRGKPVMALLPWEFYESLIETLEILGDEELMKVLRQSIKDLQEGKTIPWEKAKEKLNL